MNCSMCQMDSGENHAWDCPLNPRVIRQSFDGKLEYLPSYPKNYEDLDLFTSGSISMPDLKISVPTPPSFDDQLDFLLYELRKLLDGEKSRYIDMEKVYDEIRERLPEI